MALGVKILSKEILPALTRHSCLTLSFVKNIEPLVTPRLNFSHVGCLQSRFMVGQCKILPHTLQLKPHKAVLQNYYKPHVYRTGMPKSYSLWRKQKPKSNRRRVPKLILLQNPITWIMTKIDFGVLRSIWDPTFVLKDFKYGTKQAISRVTQAISEGQYSELNGLLTKPARLSLMRELDRNWSDRQRSLIALNNEDIQISAPRKVYFIRIADKKYCDVDMTFLALKWVPIDHIEGLIFTEIFARFHREYTPHCIPEWTIAYFKVTRFQLLRRQAAVK